MKTKLQQILEPKLPAMIDSAHEVLQDRRPRQHLGGSIIGHECERYLWLSFRWAKFKAFPGRILRLFRRGQNEEEQIAHDLRLAGCEVLTVDPETDRQFRVEEVDGHFGGSLDGAARNIPEAPTKPHVIEMKTHNDKSFKALEKDGVKKSKFVHWAQMQVYMLLRKTDRALYIAINKNDDSYYTERVKLDIEAGNSLIAKARRIIYAVDPPERIGPPTLFTCKWCDMYKVCHGTAVPDMNCRTCIFSIPKPDGDGRWFCSKHNEDLSFIKQTRGCDQHRYRPGMLDSWATFTGEDENSHYYDLKKGKGKFSNGVRRDFGFPSAEMQYLDGKALVDPELNELRKQGAVIDAFKDGDL